MILLFGTRALLRLISTATSPCPYCGATVPQEVFERKSRLTVFFVPLFTISTRYLNRCTNCSGETSLTSQQARDRVERHSTGLPA